MQQAEIMELFGPLLRQGAQRRRITDYVAVLLLVIVLAWWGYSSWLNRQVPKVTAINLVPNSILVIGPANRVMPDGHLEFCPGDTMTVRYQIAIDGSGVIFADDAAHHQNHTVKFSSTWRDIVDAGTRMYDNDWVIPQRPDMAIDGQRMWVPGRYTRVISVTASNIYISRYVPPATFEVPFYISEECP